MYKAKIAKKHRDAIAQLVLEIECGYIKQGMHERGTLGHDKGVYKQLRAEKALAEDYGIGDLFDETAQDLLDILQRTIELQSRVEGEEE